MKRETLKSEIDKARRQARCYGYCDSRGECTSTLTRKIQNQSYCFDCGRPKKEN